MRLIPKAKRDILGGTALPFQMYCAFARQLEIIMQANPANPKEFPRIVVVKFHPEQMGMREIQKS